MTYIIIRVYSNIYVLKKNIEKLMNIQYSLIYDKQYIVVDIKELQFRLYN